MWLRRPKQDVTSGAKLEGKNVRWKGGGEGRALTGVVAGDPRSAAKGLPEQRGVLPAVLHEHLLQGLRPVQLVQDDRGCERRGEHQPERDRWAVRHV